MADLIDTPAPTGFDDGRGYRVLARKYRPATFDDLIGQDAMVRTLSNAFDTGRIPQAWMLTGVRGVGKTTTARILARGLNYETPGGTGKPTIHMPEYGVHCRSIIEGRHVDVMEMDAASNTSINDIREIIDAARYKPMNARYKVYIVDEVHMLSNAAFNGLLKTLEEPPEHVKFIFATTEIRKVPVTVLSRCQRFDLRRVDAALLVTHLTGIAGKEGVTLDADAAALLARAAEGSVRDSLSLLDQAIAHGGGVVTVEIVRGMLGLADRIRVYDLLETVMKGDAPGALAIFDQEYAAGADPVTLIGELAETVHAVTRGKVAPEAARTLGAPQAEIARVQDLAGRLSMRVLARAWQMAIRGLQEVQSAPRPAIAAEMVLVRLCHAADLPTPDELVKRLADASPADVAAAAPPRAPNGGGGAAGAALAVEAPRPGPRLVAAEPMAAIAEPRASAHPMAAPPAPRAAPAMPRADLGRFEDLVALCAIKRDIPLKVALERNVHPIRFAPGRVELRLRPGANNQLVADLQKRLLEWTGERWIVVLGNEEGEPTLQQQAEARQRGLLDDVRADPAVAAVLARFPGAEIVDVREIKPEGPEPIVAAPPPEDDADNMADELPPIEAYEDDF